MYQFEGVRTRSQPRLGPQTPGWAAQENEKDVLSKPEELGVNMVQSLFSLQLTLSSPFQMKWEVYFSKELYSLVFIVLNMLLHAYEYVT